VSQERVVSQESGRGAAASDSSPSEKDIAQGPLVLVVEDYSDAREMFCELLSHHGFRCVSAQDGAEALVRAHEQRPDVVLLDLSLPVVDGWTVARSLRAEPSTHDIPIVVLTAHAHPRDHELARRSGCDRVFTKPLPHEELVAALREAIDARTLLEASAP
jgi:two-component system cell cycle response regulator DivK